MYPFGGRGRGNLGPMMNNNIGVSRGRGIGIGILEMPPLPLSHVGGGRGSSILRESPIALTVNREHMAIGPMGRRAGPMDQRAGPTFYEEDWVILGNQSGGDNRNNTTNDDSRLAAAAASAISMGNGSINGEIGTKTDTKADTSQEQDCRKKEKAERSSTELSWADIEIMRRRAEEAKWRDKPVMKKDFYREDPEITKMTNKEVEEYRQLRNNITVMDDDGHRTPPKPIKTFEQAFRDYPEILREIYKQGFKEPSPIQAQVWPIALTGHDVIGIAQTGTGKTLAFLLPIFIHLDNQPLPRNQRKGPGCIILSPTRELALQIHSEIKKYSYKGISSVCVYGGTSRKEQIDICTAGVDIVIATPGRLNDLVRVQAINLKSVTFLVLDEADRMLDMGFEPQIKKVLFEVRDDRHTIMTSATWPPLVRELGKKYTVKPFLVFVGSLDLAAVHTVTQKVYMVQEDDKMKILMDFLRNLGKDEKAIVFVGKKNLADHLSSELIVKGLNCESLHGDRDQGDREMALANIKGGKVNILVATDLASRGLDIVDVTHVFNYDFPRNIEEYVHRVGRTGRAGRKGASITLISKSDWRHANELVKILEEADQEVPIELRQMGQRYEAKQRDNPRPYRGGRNGNSDDYGGFFPSAFGKKKF